MGTSTYYVSTVALNGGKLTFKAFCGYSNKTTAMKAAKRLAADAQDCVTYGPSSLAYVGSEITAVVAWE